MDIINDIQDAERYRATTIGEPKLDQRGLYRKISVNGTTKNPNDLLNFLSLCDGYTDLHEIAQILKLPYDDIVRIKNVALEHELVK